jgi:mannose-1-phosphate guanylyltransferase/mannose-6-phosphate isomerase
MSAAEKGHLVTFGIKPTHPATGFGYIKANDRIKDYGPVEAFIEKPNKEKAEEFFKAGNYYWNSGMFVARSSVMLAEIATHAPEISSVLATMRAEWKGGADWQDVIQARFASMPSISIDYAVMEKSRNVVTVPCSIGWSDIGSWDAVYDIADKDADGNSLQVPVIALDTKNTLVFGDGKRLVATVGVEDLCIIDTADALLIAKRGHAEKVKDVVDIVKARGGEEHIIHRTAHRPWGSYTVLEDALSGFKVKRIEVIPGGRLSLQSHQHRSEHWVVVAGTATITRGDEVVTLTPNQSTYIPVGVKHRLENKGKIPIQLVEVQVGDYLGEDDIQRFDDVYGRS